MGREILFRGKRADNGEWIRGDLITTPFIRNTTQENIIYILDITKADYDCFEDLVEDNGIFEVLPETVCQYTGLTGKNGRKIFEGDIFCIHDKNTFSVDFINGSFTVIPTYEIAKKIIRRKYLDEFARLSEYIEVIGNIFDNPELLA